ncbi:MAG: recombinase family protein [Thaumarchaeota archaeon]|nr:recombinase family protein [Nitrososphaerota archaeon]
MGFAAESGVTEPPLLPTERRKQKQKGQQYDRESVDTNQLDEVQDFEKSYDWDGPDGKCTHENGHPRVAIYIRISDRQQGELSPKAQLAQLLRWVDEFMPSQIIVKADNGKSGQRFTDRKIRDISQLKEDGQLDEVWTRSVDRLGRKLFNLIWFYLTFLVDGGKIRTADYVYTNDPMSILIFVVRAFAAEIENKERIDHVVESLKRTFTVERNWFYPIPPGYEGDPGSDWIRKKAGSDDFVTFVFRRFIKLGEDPSSTPIVLLQREVVDRFGFIISRDRLRRMLSNPAYVGRPSFMGETVGDESLRYIQDGEFEEVQSILRAMKTRYSGKADEVFKDAVAKDISRVGELLSRVCAHVKEYGTSVVLNGLRTDVVPPQLSVKCLCEGKKHQWRYPLHRVKLPSMISQGKEQKASPRVEGRRCRHPNATHVLRSEDSKVVCLKCNGVCQISSHRQRLEQFGTLF